MCVVDARGIYSQWWWGCYIEIMVKRGTMSISVYRPSIECTLYYIARHRGNS